MMATSGVTQYLTQAMMKQIRTYTRVLIETATLAMLLAACGVPQTGSTGGQNPTSETATEPAAASTVPSETSDTNQITDGVWLWQKTSDIVVADPSRYSIAFLPDGALAIRADCNSVGGNYTVTNNQIAIALGATTEVGCPPDSQADEYLANLADAESYRLDEGNLLVKLKNNSGTMVFSKQQNATLTDTNWQITGLVIGGDAVASTINGSETPISFGADGVVSGSTGCNAFTGSYTTSGTSLNVGQLATTKKACSQELSGQEQTILDALGNAASYDITGNAMTINDANGVMLLTLNISE